MIYNPYSRYYSQYKDAKQAFASAGVVVMTDFDLETRPCIRERYGSLKSSTNSNCLVAKRPLSTFKLNYM